VPGHALVAIDATVTPPVPVPGDRPIYLARWRDGRFGVIDPKTRPDAHGWPYTYTDLRKLPLQPTQAYVQACGGTREVAFSIAEDELRVPMRYGCTGNHTVFLCDAGACWLAWRYW
jgi:hypothetical protein